MRSFSILNQDFRSALLSKIIFGILKKTLYIYSKECGFYLKYLLWKVVLVTSEINLGGPLKIMKLIIIKLFKYID
jgi:hypothetical protein